MGPSGSMSTEMNTEQIPVLDSGNSRVALGAIPRHDSSQGLGKFCIYTNMGVYVRVVVFVVNQCCCCHPEEQKKD